MEEGSNVKGGNVESWNIIKDEYWRLVQGEGELRRIWKEYFEDLYSIDI